jgi:hypothetical protein
MWAPGYRSPHGRCSPGTCSSAYTVKNEEFLYENEGCGHQDTALLTGDVLQGPAAMRTLLKMGNLHEYKECGTALLT